ncbi:MAG: hypothetical protein ABI718_09505 [Acidobacteriota bacterium]
MTDPSKEITVGYQRPQATVRIAKEERTALLRDYFEHYHEAAAADPSALNQKIPRGAFAGLLDRIGELLLAEARRASAERGPVRDFMAANALPGKWSELLPDEYRAFCLALNALKQWTVAESAATDRYILGGNARAELRATAATCLVTGEPLGPDAELHHPLRDGRPPVLLSKVGHARIEGQSAATENDPRVAAIVAFRSEGNRSWAMLRRGCLDLLGREVSHSTPKGAASSKTFARRASQRSGMTFEEILTWLGDRGL